MSRSESSLIRAWAGETLSAAQILKILTFERWQKKTDLADRALCQAVQEMQQGLIDADLGGGLVKKRVARPGAGKRGGYRTLLATNQDDRWIFLYGFAKNERDNIAHQELLALKRMAKELLALSVENIQTALQHGELKEIPDGTVSYPPRNA
jgi:hypothetical protein